MPFPFQSTEVEVIHFLPTTPLCRRRARENEPCIVLDERGSLCDSRQFASLLFKKIEEGGSRVTFVIGCAEGLPSAMKADTAQEPLLSLSRLTFTHQMARLLLVEQVYRASEIRRGSKYHND